MSETGLLPAYLIVGTDGVKRDHAVSRMKARLEKSGMVEFNLDERDMTKDPDIESIIGSLNTFPMGSEFRLVILDAAPSLPRRSRNRLSSTSQVPAPRRSVSLLPTHLPRIRACIRQSPRSTRSYRRLFGYQALGTAAPRSADGDAAR